MATDRLYETVAQALVVLEQILPRARSAAELTPEVVAAWVEVLRLDGVTPEEVRGAVPRILQTETFFPTPAVFLKLLRPVEDREAREEVAWQRVLECLRRYGGHASLAAADLAGDGCALAALERLQPERLSRELTEENRSLFRAEFVRIYRAFRSSGRQLAYLPGRYERENGALNHELTPMAAGRPDWEGFPGERVALGEFCS